MNEKLLPHLQLSVLQHLGDLTADVTAGEMLERLKRSNPGATYVMVRSQLEALKARGFAMRARLPEPNGTVRVRYQVTEEGKQALARHHSIIASMRDSPYRKR